jgi:phage portal protein, SPP1 gp6-like|nr:MAG TPA: portal [Caudoviricetes sp.]
MDKNHPLLRIANGLSGGQLNSLSEAVELYGQMAFTEHSNNELLQERIAELELALDDVGYERIGDSNFDKQFTKASIDKIAAMARVYWLKNPLIKRAVATQANYVFGQGVDVVAADEDVQTVVDAFMDDSKNRAELTGEQAMLTKEVELQVTANLFFTFFTDPLNGATRVRTIPLSEITRIIYNPDDSKEPWYYYRQWQQPKEPGSQKYEMHQAMYPDINYMPKGGLPKYFNGIEVMALNPVYHVKTNCLSDMEYGVSEIYAAIDWAKAYKDFLEDWYTIVKSLSKFAWKATSKSGATGMGQAKQVLEGAINGGSNPMNSDLPGQAAQVWMSSDNFDLAPMPKSGATVAVDDGRRALLMVCAATGIYEHYFGDPSTGNLATAKAMEQPMLLMFQERQELWTDVFNTILGYVINQSALKPGGKLRGVMSFNDYGESYVDMGDVDRSVDVKFPPILQEDVNERIDAIVKSVTLSGQTPANTIDLKTATTQMLTALGEDTDIVDKLFPDDPKSWDEVEDEKQQKALEIAMGQQSAADQQAAQAAKAANAIDDAEEDAKAKKDVKTPEERAAGETEESYIDMLDKMVSELRERGI